jgi:hypothetical protein
MTKRTKSLPANTTEPARSFHSNSNIYSVICQFRIADNLQNTKAHCALLPAAEGAWLGASPVPEARWAWQ